MRQGRVFCNGIAAGIITEDEQGYTFVYDEAYLSQPEAQPVSLTLPLRKEPYNNNVMFSFFDGLIPEGLHASFSCWLNYINFTFLPD